MPEVMPALTRSTATADPRQMELGQALGQAVERALALPSAAVCTTLVKPVSGIAQACTDCHREYR